ncbi:lipid asymmetry maintenance protein MlaB [Candidatus Erwinia dacicola]|uniref:Anti-sigma B factor antagonist n=1 Tax=Candidatus Erwinia dacicola TaxID=252393 RepID=A0A1E7Z3Z4_9GAMM|nr:lipid asymmetry maintenance protein MlaB [Candidatus Erwinia dacicola]NJC99342.1 lipid asymmetry maintenance protein MlaB [Candidatus Erwinia dacicola]NJD85126.1 lipid asymmetry maintenance protein MlaB [Candidatus Erwinia dacicola]OFC63507.1 anti-sigma B factor antagonist [Candidatus Erwinia dacicola]RAP72649.1 putative phospholipid ABC transporter-binding protein MlaB [Candidatus Erwinia dacicola]
MDGQLRWQVADDRLTLAGELERETLLPLWQQRAEVMGRVEIIDVAGLQRVDSDGLALLVHLRQIVLERGKAPRFTGITDKLRSLITLYNLQKIIAEGE